MHKDEELKVKLLHRLKISRGHLDRVIKMIEEDDYCIDILNQSKAIQNALKEVDSLLLENHLQTCVVDFVKNGKAKESVNEIMKVFRKQ